MMTQKQLQDLYWKEGETDLDKLRLKWIASRDELVYDYIEQRLAYTDFVKLKMSIVLLEKIHPLNKTVSSEILSKIEREILNEQVTPDIDTIIKRIIDDNIVNDSDAIDDTERQEIDRIIEIIDSIFNVLDAHLNEINDIKSTNDNLINKMNKLNREIGYLTDDIDDLIKTVDKLNDEIHDLKQELNETKIKLDETATELHNTKQERDDNQTKFDNILKQYQERITEYHQTNRDLYDINLRIQTKNNVLATENSKFRKIKDIKNNKNSAYDESNLWCCDENGMIKRRTRKNYANCP